MHLSDFELYSRWLPLLNYTLREVLLFQENDSKIEVSL